MRAFGKEKTEIFDEMKLTELKLNPPIKEANQHVPIYYHWEDLNVFTPGSNEKSIFSFLPCHKKVESRQIIKNGQYFCKNLKST